MLLSGVFAISPGGCLWMGLLLCVLFALLISYMRLRAARAKNRLAASPVTTRIGGFLRCWFRCWPVPQTGQGTRLRPSPSYADELEDRTLLSAGPLEFTVADVNQPADLLLTVEDLNGTDTVEIRDGAVVLASQALADTTAVTITGSNQDDRLTVDASAARDLIWSFFGGLGDDELAIHDPGQGPQALTHILNGSQGGSFASADGRLLQNYTGVENVSLETEADSRTVQLPNDANFTLAQDADGNLVGMIQQAFDAKTDLSGLDGSDGFQLNGSTAGGAIGTSVSRAGDVNGDGVDDLIVGAPGLDRAYVLFGSDQGFQATVDPADLDGSNGFVLTGPSGQNVGYSVSGGGDVNGDGVDDVLIGAPGPMGDFGAGVSYVVFGSASGFPADLDLTTLDGTNGFAITGLADGDASGFSVAIAGDVNGDLVDDVLIGAPGADPDAATIDAGQAYLLFGSDQGFDASVSLSTLDGKTGFALDGAAAGDAAGFAVASAGDLNNDSLADVLIGAPGADANGENSGAAYVFFGSIDFAVAEGLSGMFYQPDPSASISSLADAESVIAGNIPAATFLAYQLDYPNSDAADTIDAETSLDDFLGLNIEDLVGGDDATIDNSAFTFNGSLYVAEPGAYNFEVGSAEGFRLTIDGETVAEFDGTREFAQTSGSHTFAAPGFYAISVLYYTDDDPGGIELKSDLVTTDGSLDFISREYFFTAPAMNGFALSELDGSTGFVINGEAAGDVLGTAVGTAGDVNDDGATDAIVGAPGSDADGTDSGRAYVVFGENLTTIYDGFAPILESGELDGTAGFILAGAAAGSRAGTSVGLAGDLNNDGVDDVAIGVPGSDASQAGMVQVVFGDLSLGSPGVFDLSSLDGVTGFTASTGQAGDGFGGAVSAPGDLNADGIDDFAIGSPTSAGSGLETNAGAAYVVFGRIAGGAVSTIQYALPASSFIIDGEDAEANVTLGAPDAARTLRR